MGQRLIRCALALLTVFPAALGIGATARAEQVEGSTASFSSTVFTTREGLVGRRTANGHVIVKRDWFAALPSKLGLADRGSGDRSVKVCSDNTGRCVFLPVWDVGPWNTNDDYWNSRRRMWKDLPRGKPEAQAARSDGYHGGKDEFGRRVLNPAGIDLADGAFWDGLGLTANSWVDVTFLWTGSGERGWVDTEGGPARVRSGANLKAEVKGGAGEYAQVPIWCQVRGERVSGTVRTTNMWDKVGSGHYVSHAYIRVPRGWKVRLCPRSALERPTAGLGPQDPKQLQGTSGDGSEDLQPGHPDQGFQVWHG